MAKFYRRETDVVVLAYEAVGKVTRPYTDDDTQACDTFRWHCTINEESWEFLQDKAQKPIDEDVDAGLAGLYQLKRLLDLLRNAGYSSYHPLVVRQAYLSEERLTSLSELTDENNDKIAERRATGY